MMQILIVAATQPEIQPLIDHFGAEKPFDILITGVGMVATAFAMGSLKKYGLVLNLGIAGSFDREIALGDVVEVIEDRLSELGAEDGDQFIPIEVLGFGGSIYTATAQLSDYIETFDLRKATSITVNTVHGDDNTISLIKARLNPQLESMEGAAFLYACRQLAIPGIQIRAVSNYVEKRNRDSWKIGIAVKNLNKFAIRFIEELICRP